MFSLCFLRVSICTYNYFETVSSQLGKMPAEWGTNNLDGCFFHILWIYFPILNSLKRNDTKNIISDLFLKYLNEKTRVHFWAPNRSNDPKTNK